MPGSDGALSEPAVAQEDERSSGGRAGGDKRSDRDLVDQRKTKMTLRISPGQVKPTIRAGLAGEDK